MADKNPGKRWARKSLFKPGYFLSFLIFVCFSKKNKKNKKNGVEDIDGAAASVGGAEGAAAQVGGAEMVPAQGNMDLVKLKKALDEMTKVSLLSFFS